MSLMSYEVRTDGGVQLKEPTLRRAVAGAKGIGIVAEIWRVDRNGPYHELVARVHPNGRVERLETVR